MSEHSREGNLCEHTSGRRDLFSSTWIDMPAAGACRRSDQVSAWRGRGRNCSRCPGSLLAPAPCLSATCSLLCFRDAVVSLQPFLEHVRRSPAAHSSSGRSPGGGAPPPRSSSTLWPWPPPSLAARPSCLPWCALAVQFLLVFRSPSPSHFVSHLQLDRAAAVVLTFIPQPSSP